MKDKLGETIIIIFLGFITKTYAYWRRKKAKVTKKCIIKQDHLEWLENHQIILRSLQRFKTDAYNVYTQYVHKIALSSKVIN